MPTEISTNPSAQAQRDQVAWVVHTEDGQTFFGYDNENNEAWKLYAEKYYSGEINSPIRELWFRFRDHYELIGNYSDAFYFACCDGAWYGGEGERFFVGGTLNADGTFHTKQFSVPELIPKEGMERDRPLNELIQLGIIWKDRSKRWVDPQPQSLTPASTEQETLAPETTLPSSFVSE